MHPSGMLDLLTLPGGAGVGGVSKSFSGGGWTPPVGRLANSLTRCFGDSVTRQSSCTLHTNYVRHYVPASRFLRRMCRSRRCVVEPIRAAERAYGYVCPG